MQISTRNAYILVATASYFAFLGGRATSISFLSSKERFDEPQSSQHSHNEDANFARRNHSDGQVQCRKNQVDENNFCSVDHADDNRRNHNGGGRHSGEDLVLSRQHVAVSIKNVDSGFLSSDIHLLRSMEDLSKLKSLNLIDSYCNSTLPMGVSCIGALPHSHIALLTAPRSNQLFFNLISYDNVANINITSLIPAVQKIYAIPKANSKELNEVTKPILQWELKKKGLPQFNYDMASHFRHDDSFHVVHEVFHEVLVHPAMFAHPGPERVAIIGGRDGATLREVLKHNFVTEVKMIQTKKDVVRVLPEFGIEWSESECAEVDMHDDQMCEEDVKIDLYYDDAVSWIKEYDGDTFHVLIVDVNNPQDGIPLKELNTDVLFVHALYKSLSSEGVIAMHLGKAPFHNDPADLSTRKKWRSSLVDTLESAGFKSIHVYEDGHCDFEGPVLFLVASKNGVTSRELWSRTPALIELEIRERIFVDDEVPSLQYFDSGVMSEFLLPHKSLEVLFCKSIPTPKSCSYRIRDKLPDVPLSELDVRPSNVGDGSGRGVFTTVNITKGTTIAKDARYVVFRPPSVMTIFDYMDLSKSQLDVWRYFEGYGWQSDVYGENTFIVDKSLATFINHGCDGTYNMNSLITEDRPVTEQNATTDDAPVQRKAYDPVSDRLGYSLDYLNVALRDIMAGEELLCDYVYFTTKEDEWWNEVQLLKKICNGEDFGLITISEEEEK